MKRLKYIWIMILLIVAIQAAGQSYVIDEVCVGAERYYRIDGEKGSSYEWMLTDALGNKLSLDNPAGTPFIEVSTPGDTIYGSELNVIWNNTGVFTLSSVQTSALGCDTLQAGEVIVFEQAIVFAGNPRTVCSGESIPLHEATASHYRDLNWKTSGDGTFNNDTILQAVYTPGTSDILSGHVSLSLSATGPGKASSCTPALSVVDFTLMKTGALTSILDTTICANETPLEWGGRNFTSSTTQHDTLVSTYGCDSIATLKLTVIPAAWATIDTSLCESDLPYIWNNQSITSGGVYTAVIHSGTSCDSTVTLNLTVEGLRLSASKINVDCQGDHTGRIDLMVSGGSGSYSYSWSNGHTTPTISNLHAGSYTVTVTDNTSRCYETLTVRISEPAVADHEKPTLIAPAAIETECIPDWPDAYQDLSQFIADGGYASDNDELDESSFRLSRVDTIRSGNRLSLERTYTISDRCSHEQTAVHRLISTDHSPPVVACNFLRISINANGTYELTQADIDSIAKGTRDNCTPYDQLQFEIDPENFDCSQLNEMIGYTLTVTDRNGNSAQCNNLIAVTANYVPQITCKDTTLYLNENGEVQITDPYELLSAWVENCGMDSVFIDKTEFNCADIGLNPLRISARDVNGLVSLPCISNVTVLDSLPPVVITQDITVYLTDSEQISITADQIDKGSYDACGIDNMSLDNSDFTCADLGKHTITLSVTDIYGNTGEGTAIVTIIPLNNKPVAGDDLVETSQAIPVSFYPYENDNDPDGSINIGSFSLLTSPRYGTIRPGVNDSLIYTPDPSYFGEDFFSYRICDDGIPCTTLCDTADVTLRIHQPNTPPVANADHFSSGCFTIFGNLLENDSDPDGHEIVINTSPVLLPNYGAVSINTDGSFSYEFSPPLMVTDSFIYEICDIGFHPECDQATVYLHMFFDNDCDRNNNDGPDGHLKDPYSTDDCELFIPEGFSPDGDGINDYFRVHCIHQYPNITMTIFDRDGSILFEKEHYGDLNYWGGHENAWWDGKTDQGRLVEPDVYLYIMDRGSGRSDRGFVMVSY